MCGLVGVAGDLTAKEDKILRTLLILDTVRGEDSTGIAAIPKFGDAVVVKTVGPAFELFNLKKYENTINKQNRVVIGHNRFATQGAVNKANAHPFEFDTLVGVHNGTLRNKSKLKDANTFVVDSENLYHHIEQEGLRDAIDTVDGAYALVWWNKNEETLNFLRNKERPLWYAHSKSTKIVLWASEPWMLSVACAKHDLDIEEVKEVPADIHYAFDIDAKGHVHKPKAIDMKSNFKPPITHYTGGNFQSGAIRQQQQGWNSSATAPQQKNKVVALPPPSTTITKKNLVSDSDIEGYAGSRNVLLNVIESDVNTYGAKFLVLRDPLRPTLPISMYINNDKSPLKKIGKSIIADIGNWVHTKGAGGFFRVSVNTYKDVPEDDPALCIYDDGKGHMLTKKEWEDKFSNCDWCFDHLFAEDHGNRINDCGQCFCGTCVDLGGRRIIKKKIHKCVY